MVKNFLCAGLLALALPAVAQTLHRVAVTDLGYEEKIARYFESASYQESRRVKASSNFDDHRDALSAAAGGSQKLDARHEVDFQYGGQWVEHIDRGELHKFTADIKGEILKTGKFRIVQGRPYSTQDPEKLHDIIGRIKQGMYPNADYVLFGTLTNLEYRQENNPIQGSGAMSVGLSLELVGEFSLIDTKTFEIKAAFSALGQGEDLRLVNGPSQKAHLNRSKVMLEVAKSLGADVARQLEQQFKVPEEDTRPVAKPKELEGRVTVYR